MYLSLYRRYRPVTFDEMIGQEHITTILKNQVKAAKIGHAYLFAGTRGTGKTTAAKILARAVNCEQPKNGNPCNECETCKMLMGPSNVDVVEIDAASNNRVDEIREIREKVQFTPIAAKFKVYIIDEVHMLTDSAFNALLKTLEEPPAHAMFILATTESHKLPATILSRCMRFDFKLIGADKLEQLLKEIFAEQKKKYEPEALAAIAAAGEGSARDALSIADMCLNYSEVLKYTDVLNLLGATDFDTLSALADALLKGDIGDLFGKIDSLLKAGKSVSVLARDLLKHFRDLLIIKSCRDAAKLLSVPKDIFAKMTASAESADKDVMLSVIENFSSIEQELRYSVQPRIVLESAALRIANRLQSGQTESSQKTSTVAKTQITSADNQKNTPAHKAEASAGNQKKTPAAEVSAPRAAAQTAAGDTGASRLWGQVVKTLREQENVILYAACANITGNTVAGSDYCINANNAADEALLKRPENLAILKEMLGGYNIVIKAFGGGQKPSAGDDLKKLEEFVGKDKLKIE